MNKIEIFYLVTYLHLISIQTVSPSPGGIHSGSQTGFQILLQIYQRLKYL